MKLQLILVCIILAFRASIAAEEPRSVTFQLRDYEGQLIAIKTTAPQPAMHDLTPTELLRTLAITDKEKEEWGFYWVGNVYRFDPRTSGFARVSQGPLDGSRCKFHVGDLQAGDVVVLQKESY